MRLYVTEDPQHQAFDEWARPKLHNGWPGNPIKRQERTSEDVAEADACRVFTDASAAGEGASTSFDPESSGPPGTIAGGTEAIAGIPATDAHTTSASETTTSE